MISAAMIGTIAILGASLFLAIRGLRSHGLPASRMIRMGVIWIVIIAATALLAMQVA
jgi:hypothetical protein